MRKAIVTAASLCMLGAAGPALAAPPEIQQKSCEGAGGTFDRDHGLKNCTTTAQTQQTTGPVTNVLSGPGGGTLTGISSRTDVLAVTTTQSQKGNGDVTTTQTVTVLSSTVTGLSCTEQISSVTLTVDNSVCEQNGVFLQPRPLGPVA